MKSRTKIITALIAAGIMGGGTLAFAESGKAGWCGHEGHQAGMQCADHEPGAFVEKRLARFKADLKLTPAQEPLWQAFADQARAEAGKGMKAMREVSQDSSLSAPDRMDRRIAIMKERVATMEAVNTKFKRLYEVLTPDQRRVADIDAARASGGGHHWGHGGHNGPKGGPKGQRTPPAPANNG
jgi:hypothetical protein